MKFWLLALSIILFILLSMFAFTTLKQPTIKVGLLYSGSGTMAHNEIPVAQMFRASIEQINKEGGIQNRKIEILEFDAKSEPAAFQKGAQELTQKGVIALFGCWTSASRKAVKEVVEKEKNLLFYPVQYEGFERSQNIIYLGLSANQQINPTISFIQNHFGKDVYLVGSDYIYPKATNAYIQELAQLTELNVVAQRYYKLGSSDFSTLAEDIRAKKPSAIINTLNGDSNIAFFDALHQAGIDAREVPVFSFSVDESLITSIAKKIGTQALYGHYATWGYFDVLSKNRSDAFTQFIEQNLPKNSISDAMFSTYVGVQLFKQALLNTKEITTKALLENLKAMSINISEEIYYIDPKNNHIHREVFIGQIAKNAHIDIIWKSQDAVQPTPYPPFHNEEFWDKVVEDIYKEYHNGWEAQ